MSGKILIADDEKGLVSMMKAYFELSGYQVLTACSGNEALKKAACGPDIILLDINMPDMDGFTVCQRIREHVSCPILFLTARVETGDKIKGFTSGADDYIVKPFDSEVLILKIKAILSRSKHEEAEPKPKFITIGEYVFNTELRTITKNEEQIKLTPKEARLLELLYNYKDGLLPREKALTEIWGTNDYFTARSMDVYVTKLRKYFKDDQNIKIENVHGSGFRLVIEE